MWWIYFAKPEGSTRAPVAQAYLWGYGRLVVFASAAAVGAGIVVSLDVATDHAAVGTTVAAAAVNVPV